MKTTGDLICALIRANKAGKLDGINVAKTAKAYGLSEDDVTEYLKRERMVRR